MVKFGLENFSAKALGQPGSAIAWGVGPDDGKFFAAVAADDILDATGLHQQMGHVAQDLVAAGMAVAVVDLLEMVDVAHDAGQRLVAAPGEGKFGREPLIEIRTIPEPGKA